MSREANHVVGTSPRAQHHAASAARGASWRTRVHLPPAHVRTSTLFDATRAGRGGGRARARERATPFCVPFVMSDCFAMLCDVIAFEECPFS